MPPAQGWLYVDGCEVFNDARLWHNLGCRLGDRIAIHKNEPPPEGLSFSPCSDPTWEELDYDAEDPWFDVNEPTSGDFLGFWVESFEFGAVSKRTPYSLGGSLGGATFGRIEREQREMPIEVLLVATSDAGLRWGFDWLVSKLTGCSDCDDLTALVRLSSPDVEDLTEGMWEIRRVALIDPPSDEGSPLNFDGCHMRTVSLTLAAGDPCRYRCPDDLVVQESFDVSPGSGGYECVSGPEFLCPTDTSDFVICAEVPAPGVVMTADVNVLISAGSDGSGPLRIQGAVNPLSFDCGDDRLEVCMEMVVTGLGPFEQLLIDSSNERVWWSGPSTGFNRMDGIGYVILGDGQSPEFLSVSGCDPAWVWVVPYRFCGLSDMTQVTIQSVTKVCS